MMNLHHFPYVTQPENSAKKYYKFQWNSLLTALHEKKTAHTHNVFFGFGFVHCWSVGLMKSKIVKVK